MKKLLPILIFLCFLTSTNTYALTNFNYKGISIDNTGEIVANGNVEVRITIRNSADVQYQETHAGVATDQFGGYIVEVGSGTVVSGNLAGVATTADTRIQAETRGGGGAWVLSSVVSLSSAMQNALNNITAFAWGLKGNSGTTAGTNFIGTTDDEDLHIDVRNSGTVEQSLRMNTNQAIYRESGIAGITAGNTRGAYAVDFQIHRTDALNIAGGDYSYIGNGDDNKASDDYSYIGSGKSNEASGNGSYIGNGESNETDGSHNYIGNGYRNQAKGFKSFVGNGDDNKAGTIAVGVSSIYSYIGNGDENEAGGDYSYIGNGYDNKASDDHSYIGNGKSNEAGGEYSYIGNGESNEAGGDYSFVGNGYQNTASADYATITGGRDTKADKYGQHAFASGSFAAQGDAQTSVFVVRNTTTNGTATSLYLDGNAFQITLNDQDVWTFRAIVTGSSNDHSNYGSYIVTGFIHRNGATTTIAGVTTTTVAETSAGYDATAVVSGDALVIQVTGDGTNTMRWVARAEVSQLNY